MSAEKQLEQSQKGELGQFFTSTPIALFMISLFSKLGGHIKLLDPGCGSASLSATFFNECLKKNTILSLALDAYDIEEKIQEDALETIHICKKEANKLGIEFNAQFILGDFIKYSRDL